MRSFYEGKVLQMLSVPNGVIVAILEDITEDGKMVVEYRMLSLDTNELQRVSSNVYLLVKFGPSHRLADMQVENHLTCRSCILPNGEVLMVEEDCSAKLLDSSGYAKWLGTVKYKGEAPSDLIFDGSNIWASFVESNTLLRLDRGTMREELRIGDSKGESGFCGPTGLFAEGDNLYVCNKDSCQIWKINTKTYAAEEYASFDEPVLNYVRCNNREVVQLESGLYEI